MADRNVDRKLSHYVCGWCGSKNYHLKTESRTIPCPECGWYHGEKKYNDVPSEIKIDLANPTIT